MFITKGNFFTGFQPLCHSLGRPLPGRHLAQLLVGLGRGDAHPVDGPQAKGVVPVPVGQHGEVRQGQALLLQGPVQLPHVGRGVPGVHRQAVALPQQIAQVGPVRLLLPGQVPGPLCQPLQHGLTPVPAAGGRVRPF